MCHRRVAKSGHLSEYRAGVINHPFWGFHPPIESRASRLVLKCKNKKVCGAKECSADKPTKGKTDENKNHSVSKAGRSKSAGRSSLLGTVELSASAVHSWRWAQFGFGRR